MASVLLLLVRLEKLYNMYPLQRYITGTWFNPMTSKITENQCWRHYFSPLITIIHDLQNLFKKVWNLVANNQRNMDSLCFMGLLRLICQIPRRHHSTAQYQTHSSEVALCSLLPWYCVKLSWNIWFRDYQQVFYLERVNFHLGKDYFNLISPSI